MTPPSNNPPFPAFPPDGWVTNREAARRLGVTLSSLNCVAWRWHERLRPVARCVRHPNRGRCNIYPLAEIEQMIAERAAAARRKIPDGFVDKGGACQFFGITHFVWKTWIKQGKVRFGMRLPGPQTARVMVYAVEDLKRLKDELFGEDKLYKSSEKQWHVPAGFVRREEAWEKFGVGMPTWERWEREGTITCGRRVGQSPKLYKVEDINRLLDEYGKYCPSYPDPDRPGAYRVPLSGRDIRRREAIVDADALPLIEGGTCAWSTGDGSGFVSLNGTDFPHGTPLRRVIMGLSQSNLNVRHVNDDPLDCRRSNLVVRTVKQRVYNNRKMKGIKGQPCTSRFKGVFWETWTSKWRAVIRVDGKNHSLGRFGDELAAADAYDEAARQWFGEHARLNFPDGVDARLDNEQATRRAA